MINIDKQRVAAIKKLEELGYAFTAGDWMQRPTMRPRLQRSKLCEGTSVYVLESQGNVDGIPLWTKEDTNDLQ